MKPAIRCLLAAALLTAGVQAGETPQTLGEPAVKAATLPLMQPIYDAINQPGAERIFGFTREDVLKLGQTHSTELSGGFAGRYARAVALVRTDRGGFAAEFYFVDGVLRFTYETFEFFEETPRAGGWRNFKGLPAWERRVYFGEAGATFVEWQGEPESALAPAPAQLRERGAELLQILTHRRKIP